MKLDVFAWQEIDPTKAFHEAPKGRLRLRLSAVGAVYVQCQGYEVLAGLASEIDVTLAEDFEFRIEAPKGARAFLEAPRAPFHKSTGERFTNADRMPLESGSVLEVKAALRRMKLEQRDLLASIRAEAAASRERLAALKEPPTEAPNEPQPDAPVAAETSGAPADP